MRATADPGAERRFNEAVLDFPKEGVIHEDPAADEEIARRVGKFGKPLRAIIVKAIQQIDREVVRKLELRITDSSVKREVKELAASRAISAGLIDRLYLVYSPLQIRHALRATESGDVGDEAFLTHLVESVGFEPRPVRLEAAIRGKCMRMLLRGDLQTALDRALIGLGALFREKGLWKQEDEVIFDGGGLAEIVAQGLTRIVVELSREIQQLLHDQEKKRAGEEALDRFLTDILCEELRARLGVVVAADAGTFQYDPDSITIPTAEPYSPEHGNPVEYLKEHYGAYLEFFGAPEALLFQDQLRKMDPALFTSVENHLNYKRRKDKSQPRMKDVVPARSERTDRQLSAACPVQISSSRRLASAAGYRARKLKGSRG